MRLGDKAGDSFFARDIQRGKPFAIFGTGIGTTGNKAFNYFVVLHKCGEMKGGVVILLNQESRISLRIKGRRRAKRMNVSLG